MADDRLVRYPQAMVVERVDEETGEVLYRLDDETGEPIEPLYDFDGEAAFALVLEHEDTHEELRNKKGGKII